MPWPRFISVFPAFFGGWLTQHFSWRSIFFINIPLGLSIIWLVLWKLKGEWSGAQGDKFDLTGSVIYGAAIVAIMYGITIIPDLASIWIILAGILALAGFVKWETKVRYPVFEVSLFIENRTFAFSCLAALINYSATFAVAFLLSLYLQYIKGLSPQGAGVVLIAQPIVMAVFSPLAGKLSDRIEPRMIASLGMALTTLGLILLALITHNTTLLYIVVSLMVLGFGFALFSSPNMNAIMSSVAKKYYGIASGSVGTMRVLGQVLSMGIATLIFALSLPYPASRNTARCGLRAANALANSSSIPDSKQAASAWAPTRKTALPSMFSVAIGKDRSTPQSSST